MRTAFELEGFETERLRVLGWRSRGDEVLAAWLTSALTEAVTRELPPSWQGPLQPNVAEWIAARDEQGRLFLVEAKDGSEPLGLFMLFPPEITPATEEVRVGYVLGERAWGQGFATELLRGFVAAWDAAGPGPALLAMVTPSNRASRRVLEKAGFVLMGRDGEVLRYQQTMTYIAP